MIELAENRSPLLLTKPMRAKLLASFYLRLNQCGLKDRYKPDDILNEAIRRLEFAISSSYPTGTPSVNGAASSTSDGSIPFAKIIHNREAWLRTIGFEYIYEIKLNDKISTVNENAMISHVGHRNICFESSQPYNKHNQLLKELISQLEPEERKLLEIRLYQNLSWEEIAGIFTQNGETITDDALRQRGCRAMRSLRKLYKSNL
jgi:Sigma-70, region 4